MSGRNKRKTARSTAASKRTRREAKNAEVVDVEADADAAAAAGGGGGATTTTAATSTATAVAATRPSLLAMPPLSALTAAAAAPSSTAAPNTNANASASAAWPNTLNPVLQAAASGGMTPSATAPSSTTSDAIATLLRNEMYAHVPHLHSHPHTHTHVPSPAPAYYSDDDDDDDDEDYDEEDYYDEFGSDEDEDVEPDGGDSPSDPSLPNISGRFWCSGCRRFHRDSAENGSPARQPPPASPPPRATIPRTSRMTLCGACGREWDASTGRGCPQCRRERRRGERRAIVSAASAAATTAAAASMPIASISDTHAALQRLHPIPECYRSGRTLPTFEVGSLLDIRDTVGKWVEGKVIARDTAQRLHVHYIGWDKKWDEWVTPAHEPHRIAPHRRYTAGAGGSSAPYTRTQRVLFYANLPVPPRWRLGTISNIDGNQLRVDYLADARGNPVSTDGGPVPSNSRPHHRYQRWVSLASDEVYAEPHPHALAVAVEQVGGPRAPPVAVSAVAAAARTASSSAYTDPATGTAFWYVGKSCEIFDLFQLKWCPSIVLDVIPATGPTTSIKVHYHGYSESWDETIPVERIERWRMPRVHPPNSAGGIAADATAAAAAERSVTRGKQWSGDGNSGVLEGVIDCGVCYQRFETDSKGTRRPRVLSECGHTICSVCLKTIIDAEQLKCPFCRKAFVMRQTFPFNFTIESMITALVPKFPRFAASLGTATAPQPAASAASASASASSSDPAITALARCRLCHLPANVFCIDCCTSASTTPLCDDCFKHSHSVAIFQHHRKGLLADDQLEAQFCAEHPTERVNLYCTVCKVLCCGLCSVHRKSKHNLISVNEFVRPQRTKLVAASQHLKEKHTRLSERVQKLSSAVAEVGATTRDITAAIERERNALVISLAQAASQTADAVRAVAQMHTTRLEGELITLRESLKAVEAVQLISSEANARTDMVLARDSDLSTRVDVSVSALSPDPPARAIDTTLHVYTNPTVQPKLESELWTLRVGPSDAVSVARLVKSRVVTDVPEWFGPRSSSSASSAASASALSSIPASASPNSGSAPPRHA